MPRKPTKPLAPRKPRSFSGLPTTAPPPRSSSGITTYRQHKLKWSECNLCALQDTRRKVVLARGTVPCDILFIGEAPGPSEDVVGVPFIGPAGKLLDQMIQLSIDEMRWETGERFNHALTNLIGCIPIETGSSKFAEPPEESIEACSIRLQEFVRLAKPKAVVLVGKSAQKAVSGSEALDWPVLHWAEITHPAAILRANISARGLEIQRCVVQLKGLCSQMVGLPF